MPCVKHLELCVLHVSCAVNNMLTHVRPDSQSLFTLQGAAMTLDVVK